MGNLDDMTVHITVTTGQKITMDKQWETQDHRKVRLMSIDTDPSDAFPVIGFCYSPSANGSEYLQRWSRHGAALYTEEDDTCNLIPVLTKHEAEMRWSPQDRIPVVQLSNGNIVNLTCFLDLLAEGTATKALVTWED